MPSVLGIDISSRAIDFVRLDETTNDATWERLELTGETSFERLRSIGDAGRWDIAWFEDVYLAIIERPKTRFMPSAAALFPVFGAVVALLPAKLELWEVAPTTWRHGLGLKGNAKKAEVAEAVRRLACGAEPEHPILDWPQDAYDAYAVAYWARAINQRGLDLDAAKDKQLVIV
jgi:Holliday junction resolvasome RuvABC endonuclease subunit